MFCIQFPWLSTHNYENTDKWTPLLILIYNWGQVDASQTILSPLLYTNQVIQTCSQRAILDTAVRRLVQSMLCRCSRLQPGLISPALLCMSMGSSPELPPCLSFSILPLPSSLRVAGDSPHQRSTSKWSKSRQHVCLPSISSHRAPPHPDVM